MYTVYKSVNLINGKYYIGVHKTDDPYDSYMGSGYLIRRAIEKYGRDNFRKEILGIFTIMEDAYELERTVVTPELVSSSVCYNMKPGGYGGFDVINATRDYSDTEYRAKLSKSIKDLHASGRYDNVDYSNRYVVAQPKGWKQREESKQRMSETKKRNGVGKGDTNSQSGTMWITDGATNAKLKKGSPMPLGWWAGRCKTKK